MKKLISIAMASVFVLAACNDNSESQNKESDAATQQMATQVTQYECDSGEAINVSYTSTETAKVNYQGQDYAMKIAVSGSGTRYVGERYEWWVKGVGAGTVGTLFEHNSDGTTGDTLESCVEK